MSEEWAFSGLMIAEEIIPSKEESSPPETKSSDVATPNRSNESVGTTTAVAAGKRRITFHDDEEIVSIPCKPDTNPTAKPLAKTHDGAGFAILAAQFTDEDILCQWFRDENYTVEPALFLLPSKGALPKKPLSNARIDLAVTQKVAADGGWKHTDTSTRQSIVWALKTYTNPVAKDFYPKRYARLVEQLRDPVITKRWFVDHDYSIEPAIRLVQHCRSRRERKLEKACISFYFHQHPWNKTTRKTKESIFNALFGYWGLAQLASSRKSSIPGRSSTNSSSRSDSFDSTKRVEHFIDDIQNLERLSELFAATKDKQAQINEDQKNLQKMLQTAMTNFFAATNARQQEFSEGDVNTELVCDEVQESMRFVAALQEQIRESKSGAELIQKNVREIMERARVVRERMARAEQAMDQEKLDLENRIVALGLERQDFRNRFEAIDPDFRKKLEDHSQAAPQSNNGNEEAITKTKQDAMEGS